MQHSPHKYASNFCLELITETVSPYLPMHDLGVSSIDERVPGILEGLGADLERDDGGEVLAVARQRGDEVPRHVVVDAPRIAFQLRFHWTKAKDVL